MRIKDDTIVWHLFAPEMYQSLPQIDDAYLELTGEEAVMTSGQDGHHMEGSLHYIGRAADFRVTGIDRGTREDLRVRLSGELGVDFDVIMEQFPDNPINDHLHVEYDPK